MVVAPRLMLGLVVCTLCLAGCGDGGPALYPATGTVTFEDKPVEGASITFVSDAAMPTGISDASGKFSLTTKGKAGAPAGEYKVTVSKTEKDPSIPANPTPEDMRKMAMERGKAAGPASLVPVKYSVPQSTTLTATVTTDKAKNNFTLDLKP